ncbi:nucleoside hydrolase [Silvimonas soli]|uniref:nucleoside hydrolase n=1 Tax=Silvimonas soli TaxID=2980100 RepID=UPI0024B3993A|nr:nucleoside hydrolase [Silvimonas soli]
MKKTVLSLLLLGTALLAGCGGDSDSTGSAPKVIIDTDFNTMGDDGQLFVMATQLMAQGKIDVLGLTIESGNGWLMQEESDALKATERMGVSQRIGVYGGADYPLAYDETSIRAQQAANPNGWFGAWMFPKPQSSTDLIAPPDGFATSTTLRAQNAADFMIQTIKAHPHEITILEVGPLTNLALALRKAPEIAPLIKSIVYMGGNINVPGNSNAVAEMNWWFDPVAVQEVLRQDIPQVVIPLDVTDTVPLDQATFDAIAHNPARQTVVTQIYDTENAQFLGPDAHIFDTLTIAYLLDPTMATQTTDAWLAINTTPGEQQGQVSASTTAPIVGGSVRKIRYISKFDNARFLAQYIDLMTRAVPVVLPAN